MTKKEDDTTEHLLACEPMGVNNISPGHLENDDNVQLWHQIDEVTKFNLGNHESSSYTCMEMLCYKLLQSSLC